MMVILDRSPPQIIDNSGISHFSFLKLNFIDEKHHPLLLNKTMPKFVGIGTRMFSGNLFAVLMQSLFLDSSIRKLRMQSMDGS